MPVLRDVHIYHGSRAKCYKIALDLVVHWDELKATVAAMDTWAIGVQWHDTHSPPPPPLPQANRSSLFGSNVKTIVILSLRVCTYSTKMTGTHFQLHIQPGAVKLVLCGHWMHLSYMHPVTSENQFHCTRLYKNTKTTHKKTRNVWLLHGTLCCTACISQQPGANQGMEPVQIRHCSHATKPSHNRVNDLQFLTRIGVKSRFHTNTAYFNFTPAPHTLLLQSLHTRTISHSHSTDIFTEVHSQHSHHKLI